MIPGEIIVADGEIILNADRDTITMKVSNTGDDRCKSVATPFR